MKVVVNELEGCRRGLEVEIPGDQVSAEVERTLREMGRRARVPGFRKGKTPLDIVRVRFGKEARDEVVERMVREYAFRALEEKKLEPVQAPVLDEVSWETGRPLTFKATFEVRPTVSVAGYHSLTLTVTRRDVTEEMIEASVRDLAERAAKLEAVSGRPVQKGDFVVGTLSCRFVKGKGKDLKDEPLFLEAGSENNHADFNAAILGAEAGASRSFEVAYPEDYRAESLRGCTVAYDLNIREIKTKLVPPIDDELAKELGEFQDLAALREKVRQGLERRAKGAEEAEAKDKILAALVENHPFEVPRSLVEAQIEGRLEEAAAQMMAQGVDPTKAGIDWQAERQKLIPGAIRSVRAMLILETVAAQEGIEVTDEEVTQWLRDEARRHGLSVAALKERLDANARLSSIRRQIVREKSLDFMMSGATITREVK